MDIPVFLDDDIGELHNKQLEDIALREIGQAIAAEIPGAVELRIYTRRTDADNGPFIGDIRFVVYGRAYDSKLWYVTTAIAASWLNDGAMEPALIVQIMTEQICTAANHFLQEQGY